MDIETMIKGDPPAQNRWEDNWGMAEDHRHDKPKEQGVEHGVIVWASHDPAEEQP
jgi:hypothetical protein